MLAFCPGPGASPFIRGQVFPYYYKNINLHVI